MNVQTNPSNARIGHTARVGLAVAAACGLTAMAAAKEPPKEINVAYRLAQAKTAHFDDAQQAQKHLETVKQLGCEVSQDNHEGHSDVAYRCAKWRVLTVDKDALAHQWEEWLKQAGFETLHGHAEADGHEHGHQHKDEVQQAAYEEGESDEVAYRLSKWVTFHPKQNEEAQELIAIAKGFGCEVRESQHVGHRDIAIACPEWKHIEFASHEIAEAWQKWLTQNGFEVKHEH